MSNKLIRYLKLLTICIFGASSSAYALGTSNWSTVTEIRQGSGSSPIVKLSDPGVAETGCISAGYFRFVNADTDVGKRHFSTLLSALASGKLVQIQTVNCSGDYPYIDYVNIKH